MTDVKPLGANALHSSLVSLEPLEDHHDEALRAAYAEDQEIWDTYPHSMLGNILIQSCKQSDLPPIGFISPLLIVAPIRPLA